MQGFWSNFVSFFKGILDQIVGFFSGLFHHDTAA
jgi:hypothetical protein